MDFHYLVQREAEERLRAERAESNCARIAHENLADLYRDRIDFRRRTMIDDEPRAGPDLRPVAL